MIKENPADDFEGSDDDDDEDDDEAMMDDVNEFETKETTKLQAQAFD